MGTRGLLAYRHAGCYYIKYNDLDSYPKGLGQNLINKIPKTWKESEIDQFFQELESHPEEFRQSMSPPANDISIEWTYTIDLDNVAFVVDSSAHFDLFAIAHTKPESWISFLCQDARGQRYLDLATPRKLVATFLLSKALFLGGDPEPSMDEAFSTSIIPPSTWTKPLTPHHRRVMLFLVNAMIGETYSLMSTIHQYDAASKRFQEVAMCFLESIIPNNQAILLNRRPPLLKDESSERQSNYPWFWYRRCLVLMADQLDDQERFNLYVRAVAARANAKNLDTCTALLWSIRHVAVIEISRGNVSHSAPIPLLAAYGLDEENFISALHLLWHYLPYPRHQIVEARPSDDFGVLPPEVVLKIMAFTHQLEYPKYQFVSHSFFKLWWDSLRVATYTILPDTEPVAETSRSFNAQNPDNATPLALQLQFKWGVSQTGNIWSDELHDRREVRSVWWTFYLQMQSGGDSDDDDDEQSHTSSIQYTIAKLDTYRMVHFSPNWPEVGVPKNYLPRVRHYFSSQTSLLECDANANAN